MGGNKGKQTLADFVYDPWTLISVGWSISIHMEKNWVKVHMTPNFRYNFFWKIIKLGWFLSNFRQSELNYVKGKYFYLTSKKFFPPLPLLRDVISRTKLQPEAMAPSGSEVGKRKKNILVILLLRCWWLRRDKLHQSTVYRKCIHPQLSWY